MHGDRAGYARWQAELSRLCALSARQLGKTDIADLNFFCAAGLPGSEGIDPLKCHVRLRDWTKYIATNIERWWPDFLRDPQEGEDSPGIFRMMAIVTLLQRQLGVHYNIPFTEGDYDGRDSRNLFIHGILSGHGGSCVSLPVLTVAIARWLGYPLHLVCAKAHYFVRWDESGGERFNVECAGRGFGSYSDEHYRNWPHVITDQEVRQGYFLRNATRHEELGLFLNERGNCLLDHLRFGEALEAYYHAHQAAPRDPCIRTNWIVASVMHRAILQAMQAAECRGTK